MRVPPRMYCHGVVRGEIGDELREARDAPEIQP
jgi:hypothetical protein